MEQKNRMSATRSKWIMSPQARRRLLDTMLPEELRDLATEIARDLEDANPTGAVLGEHERAVIFSTLTREA